MSAKRDDALGLSDLAATALRDTRRGKNTVHRLDGLFRQSVFGRLAEYEDVNDADRLAIDPVMRQVVGGRAVDAQAASASQMGRFETETLALSENRAALGEHVIATAKAADTPVAELRFDVTNHPTRVAIVEALKGRRGWLTLRKLAVTTFETEEYLLFSGIDDNGRSIDHEACAKLFSVGADVHPLDPPASSIADRLQAEADQHVKATLNRSLDANNKHFAAARERLERWAEDKIYAAEKALKDTKEQIKAVRREARAATTLEEEAAIQAKLQELERRQRKQRQEIFNQEDEVADKRDELIANLQKRLSRGHSVETLFTIRWAVV